MIARIWRGWAPQATAGDYQRHYESEVRDHLQSVSGFRGARLLRRDDGQEVLFTSVTRPPAPDAGPVAWILADQLGPLLHRVGSHGGRVAGRPVLDGGERYLVECDDPAGNRIGAAVPVRRLTQTQTLVAVRDVEASSRWYRHLLEAVKLEDEGVPGDEPFVGGAAMVAAQPDRMVVPA